jgi:hypothetical protein
LAGKTHKKVCDAAEAQDVDTAAQVQGLNDAVMLKAVQIYEDKARYKQYSNADEEGGYK